MISSARNARHFGIAHELDMFAGQTIDEIHGGWAAAIESLVRIGHQIAPVAAVVGVPTVMGPLDLFDLLTGDVGSPRLVAPYTPDVLPIRIPPFVSDAGGR